MNSVEQANKLVDYYNNLLQSEVNCIVYLQTAKKCAINCVDEILKELYYIDTNQTLISGRSIDYWNEVKKEIDLL